MRMNRAMPIKAAIEDWMKLLKIYFVILMSIKNCEAGTKKHTYTENLFSFVSKNVSIYQSFNLYVPSLPLEILDRLLRLELG